MATGSRYQPSPKTPSLAPVGRVGADSADGDVVDERDDHDEDGQRENTVGEYAVDLLGNGRTCDGALVNALDEALDVAITLVGDDGIRRVVEEALGLEDDFVAVGPGSELLDSLLVAFKELDGIVATQVVGAAAWDLVLDLGERGFELGVKRPVAGRCPREPPSWWWQPDPRGRRP